MSEKKKSGGALLGAAFLMATSAIGPGFLTQSCPLLIAAYTDKKSIRKPRSSGLQKHNLPARTPETPWRQPLPNPFLPFHPAFPSETEHFPLYPGSCPRILQK